MHATDPSTSLLFGVREAIPAALRQSIAPHIPNPGWEGLAGPEWRERGLCEVRRAGSKLCGNTSCLHGCLLVLGPNDSPQVSWGDPTLTTGDPEIQANFPNLMWHLFLLTSTPNPLQLLWRAIEILLTPSQKGSLPHSWYPSIFQVGGTCVGGGGEGQLS